MAKKTRKVEDLNDVKKTIAKLLKVYDIDRSCMTVFVLLF